VEGGLNATRPDGGRGPFAPPADLQGGEIAVQQHRVRPRITLDRLRAGLVKKLAGLDDDAARRSPAGSGTNLAGLLQHLTFVESMWFAGVVAGEAPNGNRSMQVDPAVSLRTLRADYRAARAASNEIITAIGDADAPVTRNEGQVRNLRWAILAVIEETARHAGHADIIREQLDGVVGR
jgi:hypothetical protein